MTIVRAYFKRYGFKLIRVRKHYRNPHKIEFSKPKTELEASLEFSALKGPSASLKLKKEF